MLTQNIQCNLYYNCSHLFT